MEYNRKIVYDGLSLIYAGQLIALAGVCASLILLLIPKLLFLAFVSAIVVIVGALVSVVGQYRLRNEHSDYMAALIWLVIGFIFRLVTKNAEGWVSVGTSTVSSVCSLLNLFFLIRGTNCFLLQRGRKDLAGLGKISLAVNIACSAALEVLGGVTLSARDPGIFAVLLALDSIIAVVCSVVQLVYLKKSTEALR